MQDFNNTIAVINLLLVNSKRRGRTLSSSDSDNYNYIPHSLYDIHSVLVIPKCGRLSWPALWSTFRRTI